VAKSIRNYSECIENFSEILYNNNIYNAQSARSALKIGHVICKTIVFYRMYNYLTTLKSLIRIL